MMNRYQARQQVQEQATPRIDVLLQIYDRLLEKLEEARGLLAAGDAAGAAPLLARCEVAVAAMAASLDLSYGDLPKNFLRLYDFVLSRLSAGGVEGVTEALRILSTLREGLEGIRAEAVELERNGAIPPLGAEQALHTTA